MLANKVQGLKRRIATAEERTGDAGPVYDATTFVLAAVPLIYPGAAFSSIIHLETRNGLNALNIECLR